MFFFQTIKKNSIPFGKKTCLVYQIPCGDCDAVYVVETGHSIETRRREHVNAVRALDVKKNRLCVSMSLNIITK